MGIPTRIVVSERTLSKNSVELKSRTSEETKNILTDDLINTLKKTK